MEQENMTGTQGPTTEISSSPQDGAPFPPLFRLDASGRSGCAQGWLHLYFWGHESMR
jgi:hypothetical protein